jgi:2'-5' RNA ligase
LSSPAPAALRLFFALWPDEGTRAALADWSAVMLKACGGRRIAPDKVHATLAFLGARPAEELCTLIATAGAVDAPAFELVLDQAHYWKNHRIAWAGASTVPLALGTLSEALRAALSARGFAFDPKPFVPHVTLVRDAARPKDLPALAPIRWPVSGFCLVQSSGGRYNVLSNWPAQRSA